MFSFYRIKNCIRFFIAIILCLLLTNCSTSYLTRAKSHLKKNEYSQAIELLTTAENEKPNDATIKRELGIAYYKNKQLDDAEKKLNEAKSLNSKDAKTVFYLGLILERKGQLAEAIDEYKSYKNLGRSHGFNKKISARIKQLTNEKVAAEISQAIAREQSLDVSAIPENTVAVLYFENLTKSSELEPLRKGLAQMLITDLSKVKQLTVVERLKLQKLLEELKLGTTGLVDSATAPRVGKLIGASKLVKGGFTDLEGEKLRIDATLAETATSNLSNLEEISGDLTSVFQLEKKLAFSVIDDFGITLSQEEREEIQKIPTESLLAFMAYSKGLDYEDRGMFTEAKQQFQKAVDLDPHFSQAKTSVQDVDVTKSAVQEPKIDSNELESDFETTDSGTTDFAKTSRLLLTGVAASTGQTPQGDNDTREPLQEGTGTNSATPSTSTVNIIVPLPPSNN